MTNIGTSRSVGYIEIWSRAIAPFMKGAEGYMSSVANKKYPRDAAAIWFVYQVLLKINKSEDQLSQAARLIGTSSDEVKKLVEHDLSLAECRSIATALDLHDEFENISRKKGVKYVLGVSVTAGDYPFSLEVLKNLELVELELGTRAERCLHDAGIYVVSQLVAKSEKEVAAIDQLGGKTLEQIKFSLATYGLTLGVSLGEAPSI